MLQIVRWLIALSIGLSYISQTPAFEISKTGCPGTKGCVSFPTSCTTSSDCKYLVTYVPGKDSIYFEMSAKDGYVALGFNDDAGMVGTDAIICSKPTSGIAPTIGHYSLTSKNTPTITLPMPAGLFNTSKEYSGGTIKCRFTRNKVPSSGMKYDLSSKRYLIYARGTVDGTIQFHSWKDFSSNKVEMTSAAAVKTTGRALIRTHGALMLIAWVGFATVGMFTARYMKTYWGESNLFGLKIWFQVHRGCMALVVLATIISFILVFVHVGGWSNVGAHAYIGVVILVLAVVQPTIALFRPHPGDKNRFIFNWAHRLIANVAYILAMANCFIGLQVTSETQGSGYIVMIVFIVLHVALVLGYEVYLCYASDRSPRNEPADTSHQQMEMEVQGGADQDMVRRVVYVVLIVLAFSVCLAFIVLLGTSPGTRGNDLSQRRRHQSRTARTFLFKRAPLSSTFPFSREHEKAPYTTTFSRGQERQRERRALEAERARAVLY